MASFLWKDWSYVFAWTVIYLLTQLMAVSKGDCVHAGVTYPHKAAWQPDLCTRCTCEDPLPLCEPILCKNPKCDYGKGEKLELLTMQCCPVCSRRRALCEYRGQSVPHGTEWTPSVCEKCYCHDGSVHCSNETCSDIACRPGQVQQNLQGQCCPRCISAGRHCTDDSGVHRSDGDKWSPLNCVKCVCRNGNTRCMPYRCSQVSCAKGLEAVQEVGQCCPTCQRPVCLDNVENYKEGEIWRKDACTTCTCRLGQTLCRSQECNVDLTCNQTQVQRLRSGECCPRCLPGEGICIDDAKQTRYHGDMWRAGSCEFCSCSHGYIKCRTARCSRVNCLEGQILTSLPDQCCQVCVHTKTCADKGKIYQDGQSWDQDECSLCSCLSGQMHCYQQTCPDCPVGTVRRAPGANGDDCCGYCEKVGSPVLSPYGNQQPAVQPTDKLGLLTNKPLLAAVGEVTPLTTDVMDISSRDRPESIYFSILDGPLQGIIVTKENNEATVKFTLQHLRAGLIVYSNYGNSSSTEDLVRFHVADSTSSIEVLLVVNLQSEGPKAPVVMTNTGGHVIKGDTLKITSDLLEVKIQETRNDRTKEAIYTLVPRTDNPRHGEIMMMVPTPLEGAGTGWTVMDNRMMAARMIKFLQRDIDEGRIYYKHSGTNLLSDRFTFEVADASHPPSILRDQAFEITVLDDGTDAFFHPSVVLGADLGITVMENQIVPITSAHLAFSNHDTVPQNLLYRITTLLREDEGTIEHVDFPFTAVLQFTQADINSRRIIYRPPNEDVGPDMREVSFTFIVSKGKDDQQLTEHKFTIRIIPVNNNPPVFINPNPDITLPEKGSYMLTASLLEAVDPDNRIEDLELIVAEAPTKGVVERLAAGKRNVLKNGDKLTYSDIAGSTFQYIHTGGAVPLQDHISLFVSDGPHKTENTIYFKMIKLDKSAPTLLPSATCQVNVTEGATEIITKETLVFSDVDNTESNIQIILATQIIHGHLQIKRPSEAHRLRIGDSFSQEDVNEGRVSFVADQEIGTRSASELVYVNVSDSNGNVLPNQLVSVHITPVDNQAPAVVMGPDLKVDEGGEAVVNAEMISVTDVDTPLNQVMFIVETPPTFGFLQHRNQLGSESTSWQTVVTPFLLYDLTAGHIYYVQSDHKGKEPTQDYFLFSVSDGKNQSPTLRLNISIKSINDETPKVVTEQLFVGEGKTVTLTNSSIYVVDLDTLAENLRFTVIKGPANGHLLKKEFAQDAGEGASILKEKSTFTYQDVLNELVLYRHDDREVAHDSVTLHVTDGDFGDTGTLNMIIGLVSDETPRVSVNRGLRVPAGSTTVIKSQDLTATDLDSEVSQLLYTVMQDPATGYLQFNNGQVTYILSTNTAVRTFMQLDIDKGHISYVHSTGEQTGNILFKFKLTDPEGNDLIDQDFFITVLEDLQPPLVVNNKEFLVTEGSREKLTTDFLSFMDADSDASSLTYTIMEGPYLGHLELLWQPGIPIMTFTQLDLAANNVIYVHTSVSERAMDRFTFAVSDGRNEVFQSFLINIKPVDDALPVVSNNGLRVQEGVRKLVTEFDLKAEDNDTKEHLVLFSVLRPPVHGSLDLHTSGSYRSAGTFTMEDIYENRVSYQHDGSETIQDSLTFVVGDGTNKMFTLQQDQPTYRPLDTPQTFEITVVPVDDGMPIIERNIGLQYLESNGVETGNLITLKELSVTDEDTPPSNITYIITVFPEYGFIEDTRRPGVNITYFTQKDINSARLRYRLTQDSAILQDSFDFDVTDRKPNVVTGNRFHIMWSEISLGQPSFNVTETQKVLEIPVIRRGNLKQYSVVKCETLSGTATSRSDISRPGMHDFIPVSKQIQFDNWQDIKTCTVNINDDSVYEGPETLYVEISSPSFALLGRYRTASISIYDKEDETTLQFLSDVMQVDESDDHAVVTIVRYGDARDSVSVICSTRSLTATGSSLTGLESGSDFVSRGTSIEYRVVFLPGATQANCTVKLIDDSTYENMEQFELVLSDPSIQVTLGARTTTLVIINGPNDVSHVHFAKDSFIFPEDGGSIELEVLRSGSDLLHTSTVWCATRMSSPVSATPGQDYVPNSAQLVFGPGQTSQVCHVTLLDDDFEQRLEGNETFVVFLNSAVGSVLTQPHSATVTIIDDSLDIPQMAFSHGTYTVDEKNGTVNAPIVRLGDISLESSVICYTLQQTAQVMLDYGERTFTNESRILFRSGERNKSCVVNIVDDEEYEHDEVFLLKLGSPLGSSDVVALLGQLDTATVTITNHDDVPRIQFEQPAYSVHEPSVTDQISTVKIKVVRIGSVNETSNVRCSTRDGSAQSGSDYNPKSLILVFEPGTREIEFTVDVLYNSAVEWHELFSVQLGPEDPTNSVFGSVTVATVTILDNEVSGSIMLPAPPVVVSLLHYGDIKQGLKVQPSPGYALVCVTPCDVQYPSYSSIATLCEEGHINQTSMLYQWEIAMPSSSKLVTPLFVRVTDKTLFTPVDKQVLDSIYFRPFFQVRCVAQPLHKNGNPGIPLKSQSVTIGHNNPICKSPSFSPSYPSTYEAQSFLANLEYIPPDRSQHPNTVHISVQIPHQDGMLPLISTLPLHNLRFLLSDPVHRQQHLCSNIIPAKERASFLDQGFLDDFSKKDEENDHTHKAPHGPGFDFPYQFDERLRDKQSLLIYRHLNLKSCIWKFDAWYHMTELVDLCGGQIVSDFQVKDRSDTYLTIHVPLYVSYVYAIAPTGWGSLEHHTQMEFSFYYSTVLWKTGLETEGGQAGRLQVVRIRIGDDGKLVLKFRTQAKFRGQFVLKHRTAPDVKSRMIAPSLLGTRFELDLVWSQGTFDSPFQMWTATSQYSLKDYTGVYQVELIPCLVTAKQSFVHSDPLPCVAQQPERFEVPISFQQTNHPVPVIYSLNTDFQLTNNLKMFLLDPATEGMENEDWNFLGAFTRGMKLYGRVLWNPKQDLKTAYTLVLQKVYLCTGRDGYIPTYDPAGDTYGQGPQFGCIQPSKRLLHRFLILDRENQDMRVLNFHQVPFNAQFAHENQEYSDVAHRPGVDGFVMDIDPLYKVDSGYQWYLQVVYTIGPTDSSSYRNKRSSISSVSSLSASSSNWPSSPHGLKERSISSPLSAFNSWTSRSSARHNREAEKATNKHINTVVSKNGHSKHDRHNDSSTVAGGSNKKNGTNMRPLQLIRDNRPEPDNSSSLLIVVIAVPVVIIIFILVIIIFSCARKRRRKQSENMIAATTSVTKNNVRTNVITPQNRGYKFAGSADSINRTIKCNSSKNGQRNSMSSIGKCNIIKIKDINISLQKGTKGDTGTEV